MGIEDFKNSFGVDSESVIEGIALEWFNRLNVTEQSVKISQELQR
jgi:hypothetical protein